MFDGTGRLCTPRPLVVLKSVTKAVTFWDVSGNALEKFKKDDDDHQAEEEEDSYSMIQ